MSGRLSYNRVLSGAETEQRSGISPGSGDAALLDAARQGSAAAFTQLYHEYSGLVRGTLLAHMPYQDVPDAVQEVFICAWRKLAGLRDGDAIGAWLCAIARNTARQYFRARPRAPVSEAHGRGHAESAAHAPGEGGDPSSAALELLDAIQALPEAYRETMALRFVEGMTGPEIATRTGHTAGSVRVNLHRGVQLLRERLAASGRRTS